MNIWWNHWFSTAYHLINLMREAEKDVRMIGSNSNPDCVYKMVCDEWYTEPKLKNNYEYVNYCLEFCFDHSVTISHMVYSQLRYFHLHK